MAQINVILWDVDGTLLDFSAAERRALEDCFRSFQMGPCTPELLAPDSGLVKFSFMPRCSGIPALCGAWHKLLI